jgi:hypothetical protein
MGKFFLIIIAISIAPVLGTTILVTHYQLVKRAGPAPMPHEYRAPYDGHPQKQAGRERRRVSGPLMRSHSCSTSATRECESSP